MLGIDDLKGKIVGFIQELVRIPSMDPLGNEDQIADFVQGFLEDVGIDSVRIPLEKGRSSIVARISGKNSGSIVLCGHLDTVRTEKSEWRYDPFAAERAGNRVYGLGAASIAKSGLIDDAEFLFNLEPTGGKGYIGQKGEL